MKGKIIRLELQPGLNEFDLPKYRTILSAGAEDGKLCLYLYVDETYHKRMNLPVHVVATGEEINWTWQYDSERKIVFTQQKPKSIFFASIEEFFYKGSVRLGDVTWHIFAPELLNTPVPAK